MQFYAFTFLILFALNAWLDYVQLGFLPRNVAKWVAPLSDSGIFAFSAYVHPNEVLRAALEGSNNKVQLIIYVSQVYYWNFFWFVLLCWLFFQADQCWGTKYKIVFGPFQGPSFSKLSEAMRVDHVSAVCSLVASIQRCIGLWRLQEVVYTNRTPN